MKILALTTALCFLPTFAFAQDYGLSAPAEIESESLGAAKDFDAGTLQDGALDTSLWQGTSAGWAARLLTNAPLKSQDPIIRDMVRTVILSGGVPPRAETQMEAESYESARLQAVLAIESGRPDYISTLDNFLARNPDLAKSPLAQVDLALSGGNWQRACEISDTVTTERALPEWARLRATCHALRGEMSAADVTRDLLRSGGYNNPAYHAQMDALLTGQDPAAETDPTDTLVTFLATRAPKEQTMAGAAPANAKDAELAALFKSFADTELDVMASTLGNLSFDIATPDLDLETAMSDPSARATGRLFVLGQSGDAAALDAFISRAVKAGIDETVALKKLTPIIQQLPASGRVNTNLVRFTQAAILARDVGGLQQIFSALPNGPLQARIALITDALGGGFNGQSMGRDIEGRLTNPAMRTQAVTDAQIALALGATLSDAAATILADQSLPRLTLPQNQLLLLDAAVKENSRAEVTLLVATLLTIKGLNATDKARLISALTESGLPQFAGPIAADLYFDGLEAAL